MNRITTVLCLCAVGVGAWLATGPAGVAVGARQAAKNPVLVLETVRGTIEIELLRQEAPKTVEYISGLVQKGFYRGLRFHRAERTLVQIGDPNSRNVQRRNLWGQTGARPPVGVFEPAKRQSHTRGAVGLAHSGLPEYASSQFYIMRAASPSLDGKFAIFGRVIRGMAVVDRIEFQDVLKLATLREPSEQP